VDVIVSIACPPISFLRGSLPVVFWADAVFHDVVNYYPGHFSSLTPSTIRRGKQMEERSMQRCDAAIYSSNWAANSARKLIDARKIHVLPFGPGFTEEMTEEDRKLSSR
jgi:hypothetical protein